jgi:HAD superfamily hydrolase (TIGR01490 family)
MNSSSQSCAFFDIDGTLLEGFIIQNFPRYLADRGYIESTNPDKIDSIVEDYHSGKAPYRFAAENVPSLYALALKGIEINTVKSWAREFMASYLPAQILPYSKSLVKQVALLVDITIAVSGSPQEVVNELQTLGFDKVYGSLFKLNSGVYTSKVEANLILGEVKGDRIYNIADEYNIDLAKSIAFGDTDQDEPMLNIVKIPIALHPNSALKEICKSQGWKWFDDEDLYDVNQCIDWIKIQLETIKQHT